MKRVWLAALCACAFTACASAAARTLQLEQYLQWEQVRAPQISPDGNTIVYTRSRADAVEDRFVPELWVMDADGHNHRFLTEGSQPSWSPDGTRIAYVANAGASAEIFVRWMTAPGSATQVTRARLSPANLAWSPDSRSIAFRSLVPTSRTWNVGMPAPPAGATWAEEPMIIDSLVNRIDHVGRNPGYKHLFMVSAEGGEVRQLTQGEWNTGAQLALVVEISGRYDWTPDGRSIVFSADRAADRVKQFRRSFIHRLDVATKEITPVVDRPGFWASPRISPDGKLLAYFGRQDSTAAYAAQELHVMDLQTSADRILIADAPGDITDLEWANNNRGVYFVVEQAGARNIQYAAVDGSMRPITTGPHVLTLSSISKTGVAVGTATSIERPADVARFDLRGGKVQRLTAVNEDVLRDVEISRPEEIWFDSNGARVQGWIMRPPGFDPARKYPLILYIHGGPHMMYDVGFTFRMQEMAAQGYTLLFINPRGSTGYGAAFANAIDNNYPGPDVDDLMLGLDAAIARGHVDTKRMYVTGCSGGGLLTATLVTRTNRFAAAAALCAVTDWISLAGTGDTARWIYNTIRPGWWEDASAWLERSPVMHAAKVKTPTLLMTGDLDLRTPVSQAEEFYVALKMNNVPSKLVVLKRQAHGWPADPSNVMRTQLYLRKWFGEWPREDDAAKLSEFFEETFQRDLKRSPMLQTSIGIKDDYGRWDDLSEAYQIETVRLARQDLDRLETEFDPARLDDASRLSYRLFEHIANDRIAAERWRYHEYALNQMYGWNSRIPAFLIASHSVASVADAESYVARVRGARQLVEQVLAQVRTSAERGIVPPAFVLDRVIADARTVLTGAPFDGSDTHSALLADFHTKVQGLSIAQAQRDALILAATQALRNDFKPAFESIIATCDDLRAKAGVDDGVWRLPDGDQYYAWLLRKNTTTDLTADEIHTIGLQEVERIQGEMREIMARVGFKGSARAFFEFLRTDKRFYYENSAAGRQAYIADVQRILTGMQSRLPELFGVLPKARYEVRPVETFRERGAASGSFQRASADGSRPGIFYINQRDMAELPRYQMQALAYHEAIPGHHLQSALAQERTDKPRFRQYLRLPAFSEGWGLYAERMPQEIGLYRDPYSQFGRLSLELWRAARLVVDTGIHARRWSREKAIAYLDDNISNTHAENVREIERYVVMPGQATAYKIGELRILKIRATVRAELGEAFRLQDFNDELLRSGPLPMSLLESHMLSWARRSADTRSALAVTEANLRN